MPNPDDDDKEEGEIEDGEIIESGEERDFGDPEEAKGDYNDGPLSMMELLYMEMEGKGEMLQKKKKKKRKKRKKSGMSSNTDRGMADSDTDLISSKPKKSRYVDHDRMSEISEGSWPKSFSTGHSMPPNNWSPERLSPDENNPHSKRPPREKSPPGLYDSPYESENDMEDDNMLGGEMFQSLGNFERDIHGGPGRQGGIRKNRKRKMRGDKRGGGGKHRDGNRGRNPRSLNSDSQHLLCKFYLDGKCTKGDTCNYSHNATVKKMELCKFYLNGFCNKIESCIYLHSEFPCKFFHTNVECFQGDKCKFSHDVLTDEMRKVLDNHLSKDNKSDNECSIPPRPHRPSLLGSPPQHIKDMVMRKKIPSLFDLEIKPPIYQPGVGGAPPTGLGMHSPPSQSIPPPQILPPPTQAPQGPLLPTPNDFRPNFCDELRNFDSHRPPLLPNPTSSFDPDPQDYYNFDQDMRCPFNQADQGFPNGPKSFNQGKSYFGSDSAMMDVDERYQPPGPINHNIDSMYNNVNDFDEDERVNEVIKHPDQGSNSSHDKQPFNPIPWRNLDVDMRSCLKDDSDSSCGDNVKSFYSKSEKPPAGGEETPGFGLDSSSSSESDSETKKSSKDNSQQPSNSIPLHLPKKQRELFMRIQQREAANKTMPDSDDSKTEDNLVTEGKPSNVTTDMSQLVAEEDQVAEKERWYSSSEDDDDDNDQPLAAMLKNLQQQPLNKLSSTVANTTAAVTTPASTISDSSMLQLSKILQSIQSKPSGANVAKAAVKADPRRDPRRDPRSSRQPPPTTTSSTTNRSSAKVELRDPRSKPTIPPIPQPLPPPSQSSFNLNSTPVLYSELSTSSSSHLGEGLTSSHSQPPVKTIPTRLPEPIKPKSIVARKRSSASEEDIVEVSHSSTSSSAPAAAHPAIPYKLQTINVSVPNYSSVVHSVNRTVDPKLLLCDPRLMKELANEFSVLSSANESSSSSSLLSCKKKGEGSEITNGSAKVNKLRVGQHRLGVATMPAPRIKAQSSHLKKPTGSLLHTPLSLLREPPEKSVTPPSILFNTKLRDPFETINEEKTDKLDSGKEEKAVEQVSIMSPTPEPRQFEYQTAKIEPEIVVAKEPSRKEEPPPVVEKPPTPPVEVNNKVMDSFNNFDDDAEDEKSDSDMVIVEPEVEKVKKAKKVPKSPKKVSSKLPIPKDDKKSIFMVAQVGDGTCIKIKMIKPIKQESAGETSDAGDAGTGKKESKKSSAPKEPKSKANGKRVTRANKRPSASFEDALAAVSDQKPSKKPKKEQEKAVKQDNKVKVKSVKKKQKTSAVDEKLSESKEISVEVD